MTKRMELVSLRRETQFRCRFQLTQTPIHSVSRSYDRHAPFGPLATSFPRSIGNCAEITIVHVDDVCVPRSSATCQVVVEKERERRDKFMRQFRERIHFTDENNCSRRYTRIASRTMALNWIKEMYVFIRTAWRNRRPLLRHDIPHGRNDLLLKNIPTTFGHLLLAESYR